MAKLCTACRWIVDKVGDGCDELTKNQILESYAGSRRNCSQNRDGKDNLFTPPSISEDSLYIW